MEAKNAHVVDVRKVFMSQKEAQRYLGVSKDWLKSRRENGTLHYSMVGNVAFYLKAEIDNLICQGAVTGRGNFLKAKELK